jgi:hypothetical protein
MQLRQEVASAREHRERRYTGERSDEGGDQKRVADP